jgi:hypothetical protein
MIRVPQWIFIGRAGALAVGVAVAATMLFAPLKAAAQQSSACLLLERELAAYGTVQRSGPEAARLSQSIAQQRNALNTTDSHARRIGCYKRGFLFFQPSRPPECPRLLDTVESMRRNLADLTARLDRIAGPTRTDDPGKQRILRLLAENRCGPQYARFANTGRSRGLFGPLFEEDSGPQEGSRGGFWGNRTFGGAPTYRTLCVRTCDGYYFPISFATRPQGFEADAQQCRARCPSAVVELYVHENPGGTVEQMASLSGKPYGSIPTAFLYRKEYVQGCSCNPYSLALEEAEKLAAKTDPTVKVPDIVPQDETGAQVPPPGDETRAPPAPESEPGPGDIGGLNIFRGGDEQPGLLAPFPSSPGGTPNIIRIPPSGAAEPGFSPAPEGAPDAPFQNPPPRP